MVNIFYTIFFIDIILIGLFFFIGWYCKEKEHKDTWGTKKTMEITKCKELENNWAKKYPILKFFHDYYYDLYRLVRWKLDPRIYYREVKWFIQRGKRGYADCDIWGFSDYLSDILVNGLKELKNQLHGHPIGLEAGPHNVDTKGESKGTKEWKKIIDKMIWTFEATNKIRQHNWVPVFNEEDRKELRKSVKRLNKPDKSLFPDLPPRKYHLMTKREMKKYNHGWKLFKEYYFNLWD